MTGQSRTWLASAFALALLTAPAATAGEASADEDWQHDERELRIHQGADGVRFESLRDSPLGEDQMTVQFQPEDARLEHTFTATAPEDSPAETTIALQFVSLIEYREADAGHYGPEVTTVHRHNVPGLEVSLEVEDFAGGYRAQAIYTIPDRRDSDTLPLLLADGTLTLTLTMAETPRTVSGETLEPTEVLVQVRIDSYPFRAPDTYLALEYEITTDGPIANAAGREALLVAVTPYESYLEWQRAARVDGADEELAVTLISQLDTTAGEGASLFFGTSQAGRIEHAQRIGTLRTAALPDVVTDLVARGNLVLYGAVLLVTLAAVGVPVARRLREEH